MRRLYIILIAAVAAVACSKTSIIEVIEPQMIRFTTFIDRSTSRGAVTTIDNVETLSLDAYLSGSEEWEERTADPEAYIDDATLSIDEFGAVSCDVDRAWPESNGNLTFYSYAPKTGTSMTRVAPTADKEIALQFTAEDAPVDQKDLIFATSQDLNGENSVEGVTLTYNHILTKIGFSARTRYDYETPIILNSIKIQYGDKVHNQGSYSYDKTENLWSWSFDDADSFHDSAFTSEELIANAAGITLSKTATPISAEDKFMMIIPQEVEGLTAIVEYTNCYNERVEASTVIPTCTLFAGRQYTYCLSILTDELVFEPAVEDPWGEGGDLNVTLEIWNEQQLASIGCSENYPKDRNYILMADLDIANNYAGTWLPVNNYTGMFNGNGKVISNATDAIFNNISNGGVRDLTIINPSITTSSTVISTAALVANLSNGSKVENCGVVGGSIVGKAKLGGVVGTATDSTISGCYNSCTLSSPSIIGGIVGEVSGDDNTIMGCYNSATITCSDPDETTHNIGGIVGSLDKGRIISCYNTGVIHIDDRDFSSIASIVGKRGAEVTTTACYYQMGAAYGADGDSFRELTALNGAVATMNAAISTAGGTPSFTVEGDTNIPSLRGESTALFAKAIADDEWPVFNSVDTYNSITTHGDAYNYRMMNNMLYTTRAWESVGALSSTFFGNDKRITGVQIGSSSATTPQGLFATATSGAAVQDLTLANSSIAGGENVGGFIGEQTGGTITNCDIESTTISGSSYVGGIAGYISASSKVSSCSTLSGTISSTTGSYVGGIVGRNEASTITECTSASGVLVSGVTNVGGVAGDVVTSGKITLSNSAANVKATSTLVGGISGAIYGTESKIEGCEVTGGEIAGVDYAGGVVGFNSSSNITSCSVSGGSISGRNCIGGLFGESRNESGTPIISDCSVSGATISGNEICIGGAGGQLNAGNIVNCEIKDTAKVNGASYIGGVIGHIFNNSLIEECTSSSTVEGSNSYIGGVAGKITNATIKSSAMTGGNVSGVECVGGITGVYEGGTITTSNMTGGVVSGTEYIGGVIGTSNIITEFTGCNITGGEVRGDSNVGGILGGIANAISGTMKITRCDATGGLVSGQTKIGGIVGSDDNAILSIEYCDSRANVTATANNVGGIIGQAIQLGSTIKYCTYGTGTVSGLKKCGGIIGQFQDADAYYCKVLDGVVSGTSYVGGVSGNVEYGAWLWGCSNNAEVKGPATGGSCIGGVAGLAAYYSKKNTTDVAAIQGCCNTGYVNAPASNNVGGIVGRGGAGSANPVYIRASYNRGDIRGSSKVGGIAGLDNGGGLFMHACYNVSPVYVTNYVANVNFGGYILGSQPATDYPYYIINCWYMHAGDDDQAFGGYFKVGDINTSTATSIQMLNDNVPSLNATNASQLLTDPNMQYVVGNPTSSATPTLVWESQDYWN